MSGMSHRYGVTGLIFVLLVWIFGGCEMQEVGAQDEFAKANELIEQYGRTKGVRGASLDADNDRSFGECGFHFNPQDGTLTARVLLGRAFTSDTDEALKNNVRKVVKALNDSKQLQGTFELSGGRIVLDEEARMFYLKKELPVKSTSPSQLRKEMEDLLDLGAKWELHWLAWAGAIVHGHAVPPGPPLPVTRKNDHLHEKSRP
jgi:hypothetical protein